MTQSTCYLVIPIRERDGKPTILKGKLYESEELACERAIVLVDASDEFIEAIVLFFGSDGCAPETVYAYSREARTW
jgi:hypothetical protein